MAEQLRIFIIYLLDFLILRSKLYAALNYAAFRRRIKNLSGNQVITFIYKKVVSTQAMGFNPRILIFCGVITPQNIKIREFSQHG
jgi:hypothetical protein